MKPSFIVGNLLYKDALPRDAFVGGVFPLFFSVLTSLGCLTLKNIQELMQGKKGNNQVETSG